MTKALVAVGLVFVLAGLGIYAAACPCERTPGLWLTGPEADAAPPDWSFANDVGLCALEVRSWRPHSITLNCMAAAGDLYVSCSRCDGKYWSGVALQQPDARIRVGSLVYPVIVERVVDAAELDLAWQARADKLGRPAAPRPDHWWSFRLLHRPGDG